MWEEECRGAVYRMPQFTGAQKQLLVRMAGRINHGARLRDRTRQFPCHIRENTSHLILIIDNKKPPVPRPIRRASAIAFNFEELFTLDDEALLEHFELVRRVNPMLVPHGFQPDACRITRAPKTITLRFYRRVASDEYGAEIFRFSFRRPASFES